MRIPCATLLLLTPLLPAQQEDSWPTWRGTGGDGLSATGTPPTEWSEDHNLRWKTALPGVGISSPILVGDLVVVTWATAAAAAEDSADGASVPEHEFFVAAYGQGDGAPRWQTAVHRTTPHERGHRTGSLASNSPLSDGERIYAYFGSRGLHCLDLKGELLWSEQLGTLQTRKQFGEGSSPVLAGDLLILNWDHEDESFLIAFDKRTGEERWRHPRDEATNWSTPLCVEVDGRNQVVVAGTTASRGYDAVTGEEIWSCTGLTLNTIPSPVARDGIVYLMGGYQNGIIQALRLAGAAGDVTDTDHVLWRHNRSTSYVPSPLLYEDCLYFLRQNHGVLTCLDPRDGSVHYEGQRLSGMRHVYASPVGAAGRVYLFSGEGTGKVLALGPEYRELAHNTLDDVFDASPALAGDALFVRGRGHLYCLAEEDR